MIAPAPAALAREPSSFRGVMTLAEEPDENAEISSEIQQALYTCGLRLMSAGSPGKPEETEAVLLGLCFFNGRGEGGRVAG